jgi:hypothetical protein
MIRRMTRRRRRREGLEVKVPLMRAIKLLGFRPHGTYGRDPRVGEQAYVRQVTRELLNSGAFEFATEVGLLAPARRPGDVLPPLPHLAVSAPVQDERGTKSPAVLNLEVFTSRRLVRAPLVAGRVVPATLVHEPTPQNAFGGQ